MKLNDALNRIERAGSENSGATEKLIDAVELVLSTLFEKLVEADLDDPIEVVDYVFEPETSCERRKLRRGYEGPVVCSDQLPAIYGHAVTLPSGREVRFAINTTRQAALDFAEWAANGGMDRLAAEIEYRAQTARDAHLIERYATAEAAGLAAQKERLP